MESFITSLQQSIDFVLQPILIVLLLGTGIFLTIRLGFIQFRRLGHGINVVRGKYDDPNHVGDVSHFQALTTALSATVGIGNIAGVAIAIHWGGPGAIFWMWVTAVLGMATKFTEVTLAQKYRVELPPETAKTVGSVAGGPMYYIEQGLGKKWKPLAMFVAFFIMITAFLSGNAIQANTVADLLATEFGTPVWMTGLVTTAIVGLVILGGIQRIGKVTGILAPAMASLYVLGGLAVLALNYQAIFPSLQLIFTEAFNPTAGVAGTGIGLLIQTLLWGVRRGLFSNEAGQGSASIAHSAAKTKEPVSEGVVALLEPFIDTIIICTVTALVILSTGVWKQTTPTIFDLSSGDISYVLKNQSTYQSVVPPESAELNIKNGKQMDNADQLNMAWHEVAIESFYLDKNRSQVFSGKIFPNQQLAISDDGKEYRTLFGEAVETGAPLTKWAYQKALGQTGVFIVILCVLLFGISTAISWSYYGDRCANYLWGTKAILPYKIVYVIFHFVGAIASLNVIWNLGDTMIAFATVPNVIALLLLSGVAKKLTDSYFERKPWE